MFVGIVPWLVMPVALVAASSRGGTKFFAILMTLSAALVYGVPWVGDVLARVPPLDATVAARNADLLVFSLTVLCGLGLDAITKLPPTARRAAALTVRVAFTVLAVTALCFVAAYYELAALRPTSVPLWLIHSGGVDFRQEALIAGCRNAPTPRASGASHAEIKAYADDRVVIAATTDAAGYLVLSDAWFPGWRVWVDGVEQTVWRANHALRAVWLTPGRHDVEFRYVPATFRWGLLTTLLAAVALVGLVSRRSGRPLAGVILLLILAADPPAAEAKLGAAPFQLHVTPAVMTEEESLAISLELRPSAASAPVPSYDIYVGVSADSDRRGWLYMGASGVASTTAAPFRRTVTGTPSDGLKATLRGLPPGYYFIRVQFETSAAAPTRKHYAYQPLWTTIRVDPRHSGGSKVTPVLAGLGVGLLATLVFVWLPAQRRTGATVTAAR